MPFTSELEIRPASAFEWRLDAPLRYALDESGAGYVVPADFVTDFASVPRPLWALFPPYGEHTKAAVLHDFLYVSGIVTRWRADALFLRAMRELGTPRWRRLAMWAAVRLFGWVVWARARRRKSR